MWLYVDLLSKPFRGFDGKATLVVIGFIHVNRTVVGFEDRRYLGMFEIAARSEVAGNELMISFLRKDRVSLLSTYS